MPCWGTAVDSRIGHAPQVLKEATILTWRCWLEKHFKLFPVIFAGVTQTAVHTGKKTGTAEGRLVDCAGALYAHGTTTIILIPNG